jgi:predicted RNA-binding protein with PUA-like domain
MANWLIKQEPEEYGFAQLELDGQTTWDGVSNPLAQIHMRAMKPGDQLFYYHTGKEKSIVGICEVVGEPTPTEANPKHVTVVIKPVKALKNAVSLADIKGDKTFAEWELVKISRLSVMPVPAAIWKAIIKLAKG